MKEQRNFISLKKQNWRVTVAGKYGADIEQENQSFCPALERLNQVGALGPLRL